MQSCLSELGYYRPVCGVDRGSGPGTSWVYCTGCKGWTMRNINANAWPELVACVKCGRIIRTRKRHG